MSQVMVADTAVFVDATSFKLIHICFKYLQERK